MCCRYFLEVDVLFVECRFESLTDCLIFHTLQGQKVTYISDLIEPEQATPTLLPDGKLTEPVDLDRFLHAVPFHSLYDEVNDSE